MARGEGRRRRGDGLKNLCLESRLARRARHLPGSQNWRLRLLGAERPHEPRPLVEACEHTLWCSVVAESGGPGNELLGGVVRTARCPLQAPMASCCSPRNGADTKMTRMACSAQPSCLPRIEAVTTQG